MGLVSLDGWQGTALSLAAQHNQGHTTWSLCVFFATAATFYIRVSAHWSYQKFQILKAVLSIFSIHVGIYNGLWPEKVQHLPHLQGREK